MKFSTKSRYGLRLMLELALVYNKHLVQVKDISKNQGISEKYLEQIIPHLKNAGLIKSQRGAKGGYYLAMKPSEINTRQIVEAMEGTLFPVECGEKPEACDKNTQCASFVVWKKVGEAIQNTLENLTLSDLIEIYKEKKQVNMFYI